MYLRSLRLKNVKCFASNTKIDLTVGRDDDMPHRWVVVYGDNGLGKSTLLRAIAVALTGEPAINHLLPSAEGWVRGSQRTANVQVEVSRNSATDVISGQRKKPICVSWTIVGSRATTIGSQTAAAGSLHIDSGADTHLFQSYIATDQERRGWLLCGYGPHRRLTGASSEIAERVPSHGRAARLITLFHEKAALTSAERWLIELDHEARKKNDRGRLDAVKQILNDGLLHGGVKLGDIDTDRVSFKTPFSGRVPMSDLSDGYRTMLALALDLLRHVSYCFDITEVLAIENGIATVNAEGVVLVDEIDSHLHPTWQRLIAAWLHRTFPRMQFIVATHSPLIATRVSREDGMVVRLRRRTQGGGEVVDAVCEKSTELALTADQNLTSENFGLSSTRDVLVDSLLQKIRHLSARVRARKATAAERQELRAHQLQFDLEAPPVSIRDVSGTGGLK